jgi:lipopolysaccharide transport system permease protein
MTLSQSRAPRPTTVIRPDSGWAALNLAEIWQFRDLLFTLARRDVTLRYRQTALGIVWVVLQPLIAAAIFTFVFGRIAKLPTPTGVPYFVFSYAGLLCWNAFNVTLTKASACLVGNSQLVSKVYFPRLVLPISTIFSTLIDFGVALGMMAILLVANHITPHIGILMLPVWLALTLGLALAIGAFTAALTVTYRDVQYVVPVVMQFALYASPVAYAVSTVSKVPASLRKVFFLNPLVGLLEGFRWSLLGLPEMRWDLAAYSAVFVVLALFYSAFAFKRMERKFADVI